MATLARFQICTSSGYSDYLKDIKINIACAQTHALVFPFRTFTGRTSAAGILSLPSRSVSTFYVKEHVVDIVVVAFLPHTIMIICSQSPF
jgi:hypothetical protein